jgi:hypothetical protein
VAAVLAVYVCGVLEARATLDPPIPPCSDEPIWSVWLSAFHAPALAIADELGVFRELAAAPLDAVELADRLHVEVRATETIAGLLASLGFLAAEDGRFALDDTARTYLLPESPFYWGGLLRRIRENPLDCRVLIDSLRRGRAAADARLTSMWQSPKPPDAALVAFTHAMHAHSFGLAMRTVHRFDVGTSLLDVAGGSGSYAIAAALRHPGAATTVLDLPAVCVVTSEYATMYGVQDRVRVVAADMFAEPLPQGHDRILFSDIFHDWDDARCQLLAERAYAALPPGGRVLVHEMLLDADRVGPTHALGYSMIMVFVAQGRQRSADEIRGFLGAAGFRDLEVTPTANGYALIAGTK